MGSACTRGVQQDVVVGENKKAPEPAPAFIRKDKETADVNVEIGAGGTGNNADTEIIDLDSPPTSKQMFMLCCVYCCVLCCAYFCIANTTSSALPYLQLLAHDC